MLCRAAHQLLWRAAGRGAPRQVRYLIAILMAVALMMADGASASPAPDGRAAVSAATVNNSPPLSPGRAASIRQAQGTRGVLVGAAVTGAIFAAMLLLVDGDDSGPLTTPGTAD